MEIKMKLETDIAESEVHAKTLYCKIIVTFSFISDDKEVNEEVTIYYQEESDESGQEEKTLTEILAGVNTSCTPDDVAEVVLEQVKKTISLSQEDVKKLSTDITDTVESVIDNNLIQVD
jgi:hypothetical protein